MVTRLHLTQPDVLIVRVIKVMRGLVSMQIRLLIKPLVTPWVRAREWLLSSVDAHVSLEVEIK